MFKPRLLLYKGRMAQDTRILILGGGLVGLTLALALDKHGIASIVVDPLKVEPQLSSQYDARVSAVATASFNMLRTIGLTAPLETQSCPINRIEVREGATAECLDFTKAADDSPLGHMVENPHLRQMLHAEVAQAALIDFRPETRAEVLERDEAGVKVAFSDGRSGTFSLLVGAEGRASPTRTAAGIKSARWQYHHAGICTILDHEEPHNFTAHEIFYAQGPFALLPMWGEARDCKRSALVWTVPEQHAQAMLALGERGFTQEAERLMGGLLGRFTLAAPRRAYHLSHQRSAKMTDTRLALIGDAAHGIHPVAGQGLNLGFKDVAALTQVLVEGARLGLDYGDAQLLARYQRWRALDNLAVSSAADAFVRLYGVPGALASGIRRLGMGGINAIPALKSFIMAEARGLSGQLPCLLKGELV